MGGDFGMGHNNSFALIVVLFILLIIVGASWMY
ncbi:YjcZ family sporulation protein [Paenibacillus sp. BSR1-1]|nr:YjcZ family sporulation protein [Paenibacillus sp. BSR1-1]